jgi:AraC-like DNA-binding protein
MMRYFTHGERNFHTYPDPGGRRFNWEIFVLFDGHCWPVQPDGARIGGNKANFWICQPNFDYYWHGPNQVCRRATWHFSDLPEVVENAIPESGALCATLTPEELAAAERIANEIAPHFLAPTKISPLVFERGLIDLCMLAMKPFASERMKSLDKLPYSRIERVIAFYLQNIRRNPKVDEVARAGNLSTSHLRRLFYLVHDETPHRYFHRLRMKRVADHLASTEDTLAQVAGLYGFSDATDLCRAFSSFYKVSPHVWRKNIAVHHQSLGDWRMSRYGAVWRDRSDGRDAEKPGRRARRTGRGRAGAKARRGRHG